MPKIGQKIVKKPIGRTANLRAVGITCGIGSMLVGAKQAGFDVVGNVEWRKYYHAEDDQGRDTFLSNFPGAIFPFSVDELSEDELRDLTGCDIALGHPECLPGCTKVYTSRGWKQIKSILPGDLVLTHKGQFKSVVQVIKKRLTSDVLSIRTRSGAGEDGTLFITPDHPIRIGNKWVKSKDVRPGDSVQVLSVKCKGCSNDLPVWLDDRYCSVSCAVKDQWKNATPEQRRILTNNANEVTRRRCADGVHQFTDPDVRSKAMKILSANSKTGSWIEKKLNGAMLKLKLSPESQYRIGKYFVDFAFPEIGLAIECDGEYWHRDKVKERRRDQYIRRRGWSLIHFKGVDISRAAEECAEEVLRLTMNHSGEYKFIDVEVKGVESRTPKQKNRFVYNLSVIDDNSYVAKGFVVKNCGNFSNLGVSCKDRDRRMKDPCDIPLFIDLVARLRPRFFVMDDLPKSFGAFPMSEYHSRLPDYDLFPEWVSNYGYGNAQENRKRMFIVGALKTEGWVFIPGEVDHDLTVSDIIGDLLEINDEVPNHDPHEKDTQSGRFINMPSYGDRLTWAEFSEHIKSFPEGKTFEYEKADGSIKGRIGSCKVRWKGSAPVLHGGNPILHPIRCYPLTIRERARIQGFPDDFIFYGTKFNEDGQWNHEKNLHMVKQTGKAMPVQFCRYVSQQVMAFIKGEEFKASGVRLLRPNADVDNAKRWYCENVGYSDQGAACGRCWLYDRCTIRSSKYGIGEDLVTPIKNTDRPMAKKKPVPTGGTSPRVEKRTASRNIARKQTLGPPQPIKVLRFGKAGPVQSKTLPMVHVDPGVVPGNYHCECRFCSNTIGELISKSGEYYSRLERRKYYDPIESGGGGHIAKTPLHIARWAVQAYTRPGDWVLDPTAGAGTTLVESLAQGRNAAGVELEYTGIIQANVRKHATGGVTAVVGLGDTRSIETMIKTMKFNLIQNNPPYFGDQSFPGPAKEGYGKEFRDKETVFRYDQNLPNLAHLGEGPEYWDWIKKLYSVCMEHLVPGGRFVVGVKDQMRNKKPDQLHERLAEVLESIGLLHEGTAFLKHHPTTLHLNTYFNRYGVHPPYYQTILVFKKGKR